MALDALLSNLASGFRINLDSSGSASRTFSANLVPPPDAMSPKGVLQVVDQVTTTEIVQAPIELFLRSKDVRYDSVDILDPDIIGGVPVTELLGGLVNTVTTGPTTPPGVSGIIGALTGTLPVVMPVTNSVTSAVSVDVQWNVFDADNNLVTGLSWSVGGATGVGGGIAPPIGSALETLTMVFDLLFGELTADELPLQQLYLTASVRLSAAGISTPWIELPQVPLLLPVIPVPTLALFARDTNFGGPKLLVVPANSPFDKDTLSGALSTLNDTLTPLSSTASFLALFIDQVSVVVDLISTGKVAFRKANSFSNLNDIDIESGTLNDTEAEDELSSALLVGAPGRCIQCFNARSFSESEGRVDISVGRELIAIINSLASRSPVSDPPGRASVPATPDGTSWIFWDVDNFSNELSSLRFAWV